MSSLAAKLTTNAEGLIQTRLVGWSWAKMFPGRFPVNVSSLVDEVIRDVKPFHEQPEDDEQARLLQTFRLDQRLSGFYGAAHKRIIDALREKYSNAPF